MIGCILGTLGVIGIARWFHFRRHAWGGGGPCGRHWHRRHYEGWDDGIPGGFDPREGGRGGIFMRGALEPLDLTPAQERAVHAAVDELKDAARGLRGELKQSRKDIAQAFRKASFDEVVMGELYARHDTAIETLRKAFVGTAARIHDALDEKQRARLADMIESGPRAFFGRWPGGGYARPAWSW
jgi:Spy/CpxP family protein refolding chaperone